MKVWILVAYGFVQLLIGSATNATPVGTEIYTFKNARQMTVIETNMHDKMITVEETNMDDVMVTAIEYIIAQVYADNQSNDYIALIQMKISEQFADFKWIVIQVSGDQALGDIPAKYVLLSRSQNNQTSRFFILGFPNSTDQQMTVIDTNMDDEMVENVETVITKVYESNPTGDYTKLIQIAITEKLTNLTWIVIEEPKAQYFGDYLDRSPKYLYIKRDASGYDKAIYLIVGSST
ncbi:uncharacterized protein [Onthophagus taurus]|uniref:uncharacterized protein isoform X2 n=1 Tax=Onthophagus taurus TaxID=166361 RepID=UPI0039BEB3C5